MRYKNVATGAILDVPDCMKSFYTDTALYKPVNKGNAESVVVNRQVQTRKRAKKGD